MARTARRFAQIDVNYFEDDRILEAGDAWQLHLAAVFACKRAMTDGTITRRQLARVAPESLTDIAGAIDKLLGVGLFEDTGEVIIIRSWHRWNDSTEEIEGMSKKGLEGNHVRWHVRRNLVDPQCQFCCPLPPIPVVFAPRSGGRIQDVDVDGDIDGRRRYIRNQDYTLELLTRRLIQSQKRQRDLLIGERDEDTPTLTAPPTTASGLQVLEGGSLHKGEPPS